MAQAARAPQAKKPRSSTQLTQAAVVDAALDLAEREGVSALSTRRLGQELGVDSTAFYRRFRDKDELFLALGDRMRGIALERVRADVTPETHWKDVLRSAAQAVWQVAAEYPAVHALTFARVSGGDNEREGAELILAALSRLGLSKADTVLFYRTFVDTVLSLSGAAAVVASLAMEARQKDASTWSRVYVGLPSERHPATQAHAAELLAVSDEESFHNAVEAVLSAIELRIGG